MLSPQKRYSSFIMALISLCLTQDTFASKRGIDDVNNPEGSSSKRVTIQEDIDFSESSIGFSISRKTSDDSDISDSEEMVLEEPTFEERIREEYKEKWDRLQVIGLERRRDFLKNNKEYQLCKTTFSRLKWVLTHQNNFVLKATLPQRNLDFLSKLLDINKGVCAKLVFKLHKRNLITDEQRSFFNYTYAIKSALQDVKAALDERQSYEDIVTIMAKSGVLKIPQSQSWLLRNLASYARKKTYEDVLSRDDFQYLKQEKTAHVHKDDELPVMDQIIEHIEHLAAKDSAPFKFLARKDNDSNTLFGDFISKYHTFLHRDFSTGTYRGYVQDLYTSDLLSPAGKLFVKSCKGPSSHY